MGKICVERAILRPATMSRYSQLAVFAQSALLFSVPSCMWDLLKLVL